MTANQVARARTLPVREIAARVFAVEGSQWNLVTVRTSPIASEVQPPVFSCFSVDGPCRWWIHNDSPCAHVLAAMMQIQREMEAS